MIKVTYEDYIRHIGFGHYIFKHSGNTTQLIGLNGIVAQIVRGAKTEYFVQGPTV